MIASLWSPSAPAGGFQLASRRLSFLLPLFGAILIVGVTHDTDRWDNFAYQSNYHHHVGSLSTVSNTPPISLEELEQEYGVPIARVAISGLDSFVDVRLKIVDPDKALKFLQNKGAILVDNEVLIVSPHVHTPTGCVQTGYSSHIILPRKEQFNAVLK